MSDNRHNPHTVGRAENSRVAGMGGRLLDLLLPPHCIACRGPADGPGRLCPTCWSEVDFIAAPMCAGCGLPLEFDLGPDALCAGCVAAPPTFDRARAVMRYGDVGRRLVVGLKFADRTHLAPALGAWLARAGADLIETADLVVPVPLHRRRLISRRFNQSALLAHCLARQTGLIVATDALRRRRSTGSQAGLTRAQRRTNVAGAFEVAGRRRPEIKGRRVLLIDDVLTTGATVDACAATLRRAGADHIDVLTLARVVLKD